MTTRHFSDHFLESSTNVRTEFNLLKNHAYHNHRQHQNLRSIAPLAKEHRLKGVLAFYMDSGDQSPSEKRQIKPQQSHKLKGAELNSDLIFFLDICQKNFNGLFEL